MHCHNWSTNKSYMQNTMLVCPLVERCGWPCEAKIEETPGQFILYIHAEHTSADHQDDSSRYLSQAFDKQDFVRKAVKTAPINTASELIKNMQDSPTKQIDVYKQFYKLVLRLKDCSYVDAGVKFQDHLCRWLAKQHEEEVADWFSAWWCGPVKGR